MPRTTDPMKSPHSAISATRIKHAKAATWISCPSRKQTKVTNTRAIPPKNHRAAECQNLDDLQSRFIRSARWRHSPDDQSPSQDAPGRRRQQAKSASSPPNRTGRNVRTGSTPASQPDLGKGSYSTSPSPERSFCNREEFRAPAGVRKSPRNEPAGRKGGLWGFQFLAGR